MTIRYAALAGCAARRTLSSPKPSPSLNAASPAGKLRIKPAKKMACLRMGACRGDTCELRRTSERKKPLEPHGVVRVFARQRKQPLHHAAVQQLLLRLGVVLRHGGQHLRRRRTQRRVRAAQHTQQRVQAANLGQVASAVDVLHVVLQLLCRAGGAVQLSAPTDDLSGSAARRKVRVAAPPRSRAPSSATLRSSCSSLSSPVESVVSSAAMDFIRSTGLMVAACPCANAAAGMRQSRRHGSAIGVQRATRELASVTEKGAAQQRQARAHAVWRAAALTRAGCAPPWPRRTTSCLLLRFA